MKFNEKIVILRKKYGLSQSKFAKGIGVSRQAVYKWECGQSYPEVSKLLEIKLQYNISIDDLLDDTYDIPMPEKKKRKRISKKVAQQLQEEVAKQMEAEAPPTEEEEKTEAVVAETVAVEEPKAPVVEESKPEVKAEVKEEPVEAPKEEKPVEKETVKNTAKTKEEKVSLFEKLFGRR